MSAARAEFDNAVAEVMATCDEDCWELVDFDQPLCPQSQETQAGAEVSAREKVSQPR